MKYNLSPEKQIKESVETFLKNKHFYSSKGKTLLWLFDNTKKEVAKLKDEEERKIYYKALSTAKEKYKDKLDFVFIGTVPAN